jgi:phosphoribosyl-ATP pyrophosphohydrolase
MTAIPPVALGPSQTLAEALAHLAAVIDARALEPAETSWTAKLLAAGPARCAKKLGEEAVETALALIAEAPEAVASEAADLLYHLLVGLRSRGVALEKIATTPSPHPGRRRNRAR